MHRNFQAFSRLAVKRRWFQDLRTESPAVPNAIAAFLLFLEMRLENCRTFILAGVKGIRFRTC